MAELSVTLSSTLKLKNPVLTASGTFGYGDDVPELVDVNLLGGVVTKSITGEPREGNEPPRIAETPSGMLNAIGLANIGVMRFCEEKLPVLSALDTAAIVSIAGSTHDEYLEVLETVEAANPDIAGYEINISCPNVERGGMEFGIDANSTSALTGALRALTNRFLMIKLSPNVTSIEDIALAAEGSGADAVSAINTLVGMDIDPWMGRKSLHSGTGGLSGPAIRPVALAQVAKVANAVRIPVVGIGGITSVEDVLRFIRVGATAVQIGTANYRDPGIGTRIAAELPAAFDRIGATNIEELRGRMT